VVQLLTSRQNAKRNHGPGTPCNVTDWNTLTTTNTNAMKKRKADMQKEKRKK
jgi:hypothetical protein